MVNKRFNRKFRRALGAALGALSVASISNIETIGAAFTETSLAKDHELKRVFTMLKAQKKKIFDKAHDISLNVKYMVPESGHGTEKWGPFNVEYSYPIHYGKIGQWDGAYVITFKHPLFPQSVRVTVMKSENLGGEGNDYLIAPAMTKWEYEQYASTHNIPWIGNWLKPNDARPPHHTSWLRKNTGMSPDQPKPTFAQRGNVENRWDPMLPRPPFHLRVGAPADCDWLTRWHSTGLVDVSIWNDVLGDSANKHKMYCDINTCPPELRSFYYPEEKKEDTTTPYRDSAPAPVITPSPMNMAPAMAALGVIPATMALANQSAPTPAHVVANNNVTQGSNNVGAAPAAQNGSVTTGSNNVGNASSSQSGSDGKPTNSRHGVGPGVELKESMEPIRS